MTQSELAALASVSTVLVSKLEQGQYENINAAVLARIARALKMTADEEEFMTGLLVPAPSVAETIETVPQWIEQGISVINHPTAIVNPRFDVLAWNSKLVGFLGDISAVPKEDRNVVISMFCNPMMRRLFKDWDDNARAMISGLKMNYSLVPPYRSGIAALVEHVAKRDETFLPMWEEAIPKSSTKVVKKSVHPIHGEIDISEMVTQIVGEPFLSRVEFIPATESARRKFEFLEERRRKQTVRVVQLGSSAHYPMLDKPLCQNQKSH